MFSCFLQSGTFNIGGRPYVLRSVTRTLPPVRESRGNGRMVRTVDLGDVTEMSHEIERELREKMVDISEDLTFLHRYCCELYLRYLTAINAITFDSNYWIQFSPSCPSKYAILSFLTSL